MTSRNAKVSGTLLAAALSASLAMGQASWVSGDFHQHTTYTDGSYSMAHMMSQNPAFGLDWWANSEHGGGFARDGYGDATNATGQYRYWDNTNVYPANLIQGTVSMSGGHRNMWRWQSIRDFSFADVQAARIANPTKQIIQGLEWNVPGHEHCSTAIITGQYGANANASAMAEFEYKFDAGDGDQIGGAAQGWVKSTQSGHSKAVEAAAWMQANHPTTSWMVPAHVERRGTYATGGYNIEHFRDMNNAGPDVCFGFEGAPGHQKSSSRGGFNPASSFGGTYGGAGKYTAQVGGLWDAMLGEGRRWFNFASSDAHSTNPSDGDFYPGEYQKNWTYVADRSNPQSIVDGLRSGNSWHVMGDLITQLEFSANGTSMGGELTVSPGELVTILVRVKDPETPNHGGFTPTLDHIDLIAGDVTALIDPTDPAYTVATNSTTHVIQRFDGSSWTVDGEWREMSFTIPMQKDMYFRLRGTNNALGQPFETDADGNPLADSLASNLGLDGAAEAWADLWFYSNPIFVRVPEPATLALLAVAVVGMRRRS